MFKIICISILALVFSTTAYSHTNSKCPDLSFDAMIEAIKSNKVTVVQCLIKEGFDVDAKTDGDHTALILTAYNGNTEIARSLIAKGADVNVQNNYGRTALTLAAYRGNTEIASSLIAEGADVNLQDKDGKTALIHSDARTL